MTTERRGNEPLLGEIYDAKRALSLMRSALSGLRDAEILVISAYLTEGGLRELLSDVSPTNRVRILVRWQPGDLATGASDLASFDFAHARGWGFFASQSLHAKAFLFGDQAIFIGSANLTRRGFSVDMEHGNIEIVTRVPATTQNAQFLREMFSDAIEVNQALVDQAREWLDAYGSRVAAGENDNMPAWPLLQAERARQTQDVASLTVSECFLTDGGWLRSGRTERDLLTSEQEHDVSMLAQVGLMNQSGIVPAMRQTKMFRWLAHQLRTAENGELYFGAITAKLHDALIDDPRPYRRDVKTLVVFLLSWIKAFPDCGVRLDRPNHSERVRLA